MLPALLSLQLLSAGQAASQECSFDDPMFRRCLSWMLTGQRGALIDSLCLDEYNIPAPSIFLCAREAYSGFPSSTDRETCAIIFDEEAKKVRAAFIRTPLTGPLASGIQPHVAH